MTYHVAVIDPAVKDGRQNLWSTGILDFVTSNAGKRSTANPHLTYAIVQDNDATPMSYWVNGEPVGADAITTPKVKTNALKASFYNVVTKAEEAISGTPAFVEALDAFMVIHARDNRQSKAQKALPLVAEATAYAIDDSGSPVLETYWYVNGKRSDESTARATRTHIDSKLNAVDTSIAAHWGIDRTRLPKGFPTVLRPFLSADSDAARADLAAALPYLQSAQGKSPLIDALLQVAQLASQGGVSTTSDNGLEADDDEPATAEPVFGNFE